MVTSRHESPEGNDKLLTFEEEEGDLCQSEILRSELCWTKALLPLFPTKPTLKTSQVVPTPVLTSTQNLWQCVYLTSELTEGLI